MDNLRAKLEAKTAEIRARDEEAKKAAFDRFMSNPFVRMAISDLSPSDGKLETVLKATFESGWNTGCGFTAGEFMKVMFR